jgi:signal transduction histidine kinase
VLSQGPRLDDFLAANRAEILARSRTMLAAREVPTPTESELANGLPLFLDQLVEILGAKNGQGTSTRTGNNNLSVGIAASATVHGGDMLRLGLTVGQVVQDYGSICQCVTEVAAERGVAISAEDFHTFNACMDDAIAQAVTAYQHQRDRTVDSPGVAQMGFLAHEMRNLLTTSMFTYEALRRGNVGIMGRTGDMLGRSLRHMRSLIDRALADVRLAAGLQVPELVSIAELVEEIEIVATSEATRRDIRLSVEAGPPEAIVEGDRQILTSVVVNLVQNALKFTHPRGHVTIRGKMADDRVRIEVEDECGGLPAGVAERMFRPFQQHASDRTGVGLGLTISLQGARSCGGDLHVQDLPGRGCVFTVDLPRAPTSAEERKRPRDPAPQPSLRA